jgi:IclR family pca regulon transcriptional regulator
VPAIRRLPAALSDVAAVDAPSDDAVTRPPAGIDAVDAAGVPADADPPEGDADRRDHVAGLDKGLAVLQAFDQERSRLTIADVAARTQLSRAAARRYLLTLTRLGYIDHDGKGFALTARLLRLGQGYMRSGRLPRIIQPVLNKLALTLQEASSAGVLDGADVISVAATTGGRIVSTTLQPGTHVPAYCTANGRVLLAGLAPAELDAWLARHADGFRALTPRTLVTPAALTSEITRARAQGYAQVDEEFETGLRTLAVPITNRLGQVQAALNVSVHSARVRAQDLPGRALPLLMQVQNELKGLL